MHELQAALEIINIVRDEMNKRNLSRIRTVGLRLGAISGFNPDALSFGFEAAVQNTPLQGTQLKIEFVPVEGECLSCREYVRPKDPVFICPVCGSSKLVLKKGEELEISYLEGD